MSERDFTNPFSDYGHIVHGDRFIDRRSSIRAVENRVIRPKEPGNLAIMSVITGSVKVAWRISPLWSARTIF
jgi:hypothetical protein